VNPAYFALVFFFFGSLYGIGDSIVTLNHRQEESFWKLYGRRGNDHVRIHAAAKDIRGGNYNVSLEVLMTFGGPTCCVRLRHPSRTLFSYPAIACADTLAAFWLGLSSGKPRLC
jgi:hypothetical protein